MSTALLGVFYGILAMLGWGIGEFTAKKAVDTAPEHKVYFWAQLISMSLSGIVLLITKGYTSNITTLSIFLTSIVGITYTIAYLNAYTAYKIGKVAIVSPILCSYGMLSSILAAVFLNQRVSTLQLLGIIIIVLSTVLISLDFSSLKEKKISILSGVKEAIITFIFFGINSVILDYVLESTNTFVVNFGSALVSLISLVFFTLITKQTIKLEKNERGGLIFLFATAILTFLANLAFIYGYTIGDSILISPIGSASGVITAILSFIFLKERVTRLQGIGIFTTFIGIVLLSL